MSADPAATYGVEVVRTRVFAAAPAGGNPCPVALAADAMSSDEMRALAAHYGQDAVFMLRPRTAESAVRLRFFVPAHELALSIHATIAALTVALERGSVRASPLLVETELGLVRAEWHDTGFGVIVGADQWEPDFGRVVSEPDIVRLAEMLRIRRADIDDRTTPVQSASVSRAKLIVPLHDTATLHALDPDLEQIWRACEGWRTTGVYAFARSPEPRLHVEARQYPLRAGFVEDPATGVAAGALAAYLVAHAVFGPQREGVHEFAIGQGRAMGRPSEITARCWVESGRITRTQVAGRADIDGTETYAATRIAAGGPQRTLGG